MSPARKSTRKKKPAAKPPRSETKVELVAGDRSQRLGGRHECYACGAKFYDLNKPEPVCPKCQANQLERPKNEPVVKAAPAPKAAPRVREMAYLDDEEPAEADSSSDGEAAASAAPAADNLFDDQVEASTEDED
jgi:hypothetical protein